MPPRCENCGAPVPEAFCGACGQSRRSPIVSLRAFAGQVLDDVAGIDSRVVRTLRALFLHPGRLTREYLDGRRVRYTGPVQLYLAAAAVFFLVGAYRPFVQVDTERRQIVAQLPGMMVGNDVADARISAAGHAAELELFAERFASAINGVLPVFLVGSVALFSLLLYAVGHRREPRYLPHAVFALHWTAFYLTVIAAARLLPAGWQLQDLSLLAGLAWLAQAHRRVHGDRAPVAVGKALLLLVAFLFLLVAWVQGAVTLALRTV